MRNNRLLLLMLLFIFINNVFAQSFLGKTKEQIKKELTKDLHPNKFQDCVGVSDITGERGTFVRYWWKSHLDSDINFRVYFNKNGICIVEEIYTKNKELAKEFYNLYNNNKLYNFYESRTPEEIDSHIFVENKTSVEVTISLVPQFSLMFYHFWLFNSTNIQGVSDFFVTYYENKNGK